jgi:hypothetical protein
MASNDRSQRSLGALVNDAAEESSRLARQELELARAELRESATAAGLGLAGFSVAALMATIGTLFFALAAMFGIATWLPLWSAALIVGAVVYAGAGLAALLAKSSTEAVHLPNRTARTLKEDAKWLSRASSSSSTTS